MGVLKNIEKMMTAEEISKSEQEYLQDTAHLRAAKDALARSLADYIAAAIKSKEISQNDLRRELKMSSATMTEIINGRGNPTIETIAKFGLAFGKVPKLVWEEIGQHADDGDEEDSIT